MPEFIDPVFTKTSPERSFSLKTSVLAGFRENRVYNFGHCCWLVSTISGILVVIAFPSAVDAVMFLYSLLLLASHKCCCRLHCFSKHHCFWCHPYCVGSHVVAFIPAVACVPAVVSGHDIAVVLNVACCCRYCCSLCTAVACIQTVAGILAVPGVL